MNIKTNSLFTTRKRLLAAVLVIVLIFGALMIRLGYLQLYRGRELQGRAAEQWYRDLPLRARRGVIYDCNGTVLVDNTDVFTVYVRPRAVTDPAGVASYLAVALDLDEQKLYDKIKARKVSEITVKKAVDFETGAALRDLGLAGVYFTVDSKRNYPYDSMLSQVIGYTNVDNVGQNGLEGYYDAYLKGVDGFAYTATDNKGVETESNVTRYVPATAGAALTLTVDSSIQSFVETAIVSAKQEWQARSAAMIVMDVKTGGIVAMGLTPAYDLNDVPRDDINMLNAFSKNTMIVDVYEPGSTFKIFTTATAIEKGVVDDNNTFYCPGYRIVDGQRIKCWRTIGHGSQHLAEGVKNSCNCVFMDLALKLGTDKLYDGLQDFGFGAKTGVDFFSESSGLLMNRKAVKTVDLARIGFGQAVAVTPLQLVTAVSAVVGGGIKHTPHFVTRAVDGMGNVLYQREAVGERVLSAATSAKMCTLLEQVVSEGSGKKASVPGYRIGGKTGTAQKYQNGAIAQGKYVSSFVGFAPVDDPQYTILMVIDEPGGYAYYGSVTAAPYVGQVFKKIFDYKGIAPTAVEPNVSYIAMPAVEGLALDEAVGVLEQAGLKCEIAGERGTVIATLPLAGEQVPVGDVVLVRAA